MTFKTTPFDFDSWMADFASATVRHGGFIVAGPSTAPAPAFTAPTAPVTPPPAHAPARAGRCFRPNGDEYFPRKVDAYGLKTTDVEFIRRAYEKRMSVLLSGAPGCGKTAVVEAALDGVITLQGSSDTEASDFTGTWVQSPDGTFTWKDGGFVEACEAGLPYLIDEIALIDSRALAVVYAAMDGRTEFNIPANPDRPTVVVKEGFKVYGAYNPDVPGVVVSDALLSRFTMKLEMVTDWKIAKRLGVCEEAIKVAMNLNIKKNSWEISAAPQLRELLAFKQVEEVFGLDAAISNMLSFAHPEDLAAYQEAAQAVWARTPKPLVF